MSNAGGGAIILVPLVIPVLAGGAVAYLAYKGVCLAAQGVKMGCEEVKQRRQEAIKRRERDLALLERLRTLSAQSRGTTELREIEKEIQNICESREEEKADRIKLAEKWKDEQKRLVEDRFNAIAEMGGDRKRVDKAKENYLKSIADFTPPGPQRVEDRFSAELDRLKIRAESMRKHLNSAISSGESGSFHYLLGKGKFSEAITEGYRLIRLDSECKELEQTLFSLRLHIMSETSVPDNKVSEWIEKLMDAEQAVLEKNAEAAERTIKEIQNALDEWKSRKSELSQAKKARKTLNRLEAFCEDCLLPELGEKERELEAITKAFQAGRYEDVAFQGEMLIEKWEDEESFSLESKVADIAQFIPQQVESVLEDMGYEIEGKREGNENNITGLRDDRVFQIWYDPDSGNMRYDLSQQGFPSQNVCDKELADFLVRLAEKGILVDTLTKPTHPKGNQLEAVACEILEALEDIGVDPCDIEREDAGETIRFFVFSGTEERELLVDSDGKTYMDGDPLDIEDIKDAVSDREDDREREYE